MKMNETFKHEDDEATIEHLVSKLNPDRRRFGEGRRVLAHRRCNLQRSALECSLMPLYIGWIKGGRKGKNPVAQLIDLIRLFQIIPPAVIRLND